MKQQGLVGSWIFFLALLFYSSDCVAETIYLKDGRKVRARITKRTEKSITIDFYGVPITYWLDEIEKIENTQSAASTEQSEQTQPKETSGKSKAQTAPEEHLLSSATTLPNRQDTPPLGLSSPQRAVLRWKTRILVGREAIAPPLALNGHEVYLNTADGAVHVYDVQTGNERLAFSAPGGIASTPLLAEGTLYYGTGDGHFYAVNLASKRVLWKFATKATTEASAALEAHQQTLGYVPDEVGRAYERTNEFRRIAAASLLANGTVYFASVDGVLYALESATGTMRWMFKTGSFIESSPVMNEGIIFVGSQDGRLYAVDQRTGKERWHYQVERDWPSQPVVSDGVVYFEAGWTLYAIDTKTGALAWRFKTPGPIGSLLTVHKEMAYFTTQGKLYAFDVKTGQERWHADGYYNSRAIPIVAGPVVYCAGSDGTLHALDRENGQERWRFKTEGKVLTPVVVDEVVVAASEDGHLYAITGVEASQTTVSGPVPLVVPTIEASSVPEVRVEHFPGFRWSRDVYLGTLSASMLSKEAIYLIAGDSSSTYNVYVLNPSTGEKQGELGIMGEGVRVSLTTDRGMAFVIRPHQASPQSIKIAAIDVVSHAPRWEREFAGPLTQRPAVLDEAPVVAHGTVYFKGEDDFLHALDELTGDVRWTIPLRDVFGNSRCIHQYTASASVLLATCRENGDGVLSAFNVASGQWLWNITVEGSLWKAWKGPPAIVDGVVYAGSGNEKLFGRLYAMDAASGTILWKAAVDATVVTTPVVHDSTVYVGCEAGHLHAFDRQKGTERWQVQLDVEATEPVVSGAAVYVGAGDDYARGGLYALDAETGAVRWHVKTEGAVIASPVLANGSLYVGTDYNRFGRFYAVDSQTGKVLWNLSLGKSVRLPAVVHQGIVYVASYDKVYALTEAKPGS
jgi:outer membrane protein assembly factor BamB